MRAIITLCFYNFEPIFEVQKLFFQGSFFLKFWPYVIREQFLHKWHMHPKTTYKKDPNLLSENSNYVLAAKFT